MFQMLFQRAQSTVDTALSAAINKLVMTVPFLIAAGFATSATYSYFSQIYGSLATQAGMAAGFAGIGLIVAGALRGRPGDASPVRTSAADTAAVNSDATAGSADGQIPGATERPPLNAEDKELAMAALSAVAPVALPVVLRFAMRNIPLVIAVVVAVVLLLQSNRFNEVAPVDDTAAAS